MDDIGEERRFGIDMTQLKKDLALNRIVDINFAFNNHKLIYLLEQRGEAIQKKDYDQKAKIENKINKKIFDNYGEVTD